MQSPVKTIKRAQKEAHLARKIAELLLRASLDDARLKDIFITHVKLSADKSLCTVYFYSTHGQEYFDELLTILKLYKPSMRKALSETIHSRYTPDLVFTFDRLFEKHQRIEQLIETVKDETTQESNEEIPSES